MLQQALRVAKRVHTETSIDLVSGSLVQAGLTRAEAELGGLGGLSVLVVGAGGMGALAATTAARAGASTVVIANRNHDRARSVAERVGGTALPLSRLRDALAGADVVISSTGAPARVVLLDDVREALAARDGRPQVYVDLALPHDVDLAVADLPGATRVGLGELGEDLADAGSAPAGRRGSRPGHRARSRRTSWPGRRRRSPRPSRRCAPTRPCWSRRSCAGSSAASPT